MQNRNYVFAASIAAAALLLLGATRSIASESTSPQNPAPQNRIIRTSGTAVVYGKPDVATIELGVTKVSNRVTTSKAECDEAMKKVQDAIRKAGVGADDMQTVNYQIYPVQDKPTSPRQWKVAHYISVKVRKVANVAAIVDAAALNGATNISQVQYSIEKILDLRSKARAEAVKVAREKAGELARLNGVQLGDPVTISDNSYEPYYAQTSSNSYMDYSGAPSSGLANVITGGQIAVSARADVEFSIR